MNIEDYNKQALAFMSKALNIPVIMTPDTKLQGMEVERDMFAKLFMRESKERAILESACTEALYWLDKQAPGPAWTALRNGLDDARKAQ